MTAGVRRRVLRASAGAVAARTAFARLAAMSWPAGATASAPGPGAAPAPDAPGAPRRFAFALVGDVPYGEAGAARFAGVLRELDADDLACVIHVGDLKGGGERCDDALLAGRIRLLSSSAHPLVLLPGDNDWTDCHRPSAGAYEPLERLDALRALAFGTAGALARDDAARASLRLERQPGTPENVRWRVGDVHFVGLHVAGSADGRRGGPADRAASEARRRAVLAWLSAARDDALRARAGSLVVAFHANPGFARPPPAYADFVDALRDTAEAFAAPILLLHGDTHVFRADRALADARGRPYAHVTRVECFGHPLDRAWVRIAHDPALPERFTVATRELPAVPPP